MTVQSTPMADDQNSRLQVEHWPLDRLSPYARNARTHSPAQVAEIAGSIRAFGFSNPILVGEGLTSSPGMVGWRLPGNWRSRRRRSSFCAASAMFNEGNWSWPTTGSRRMPDGTSRCSGWN
jgi:hypothetical protein